jgi:hypothetical protein
MWNVGENRNARRILARKFEVKRTLGKTRDGWKDNIKKKLRGIDWD